MSSSQISPPAFEEDSKCKSCNVKWTLTLRRHHCRSCGGSFCDKCSSHRDFLFHYGLKERERTCDACHRYLRSISPVATDCNYTIPHYLSRIGGSQTPATPGKLDIITFSPFAAEDDEYEGTQEEQCRDAIKCNDYNAVKRYLEAGVSPSYVDKTGNTLLHLACIMDKLPIIKLLCDKGANPYAQNQLPQPETAYDVASPAMKYKFKTLYPPEKYGASLPKPVKKVAKKRPDADAQVAQQSPE